MTGTPPSDAVAAPVPIAPPKPRPPEPPIAPRELHGRVSPAVVALVVSAGASRPATVAPGVLVTASGLIVTSRAAIRGVIDGTASVAVVRSGTNGRLGARAVADAVPARLVAVADDLDLAIVEAMPEQSVFYPHLPIARRATDMGASAWVVSHGKKRGLWSGALVSLGAPIGKTGAARWQRAVPADDSAVTPGAALVDGVGRVVGLVTSATAGGGVVAVDAEGLWRFLLAANAPALRFAGVPPLRRPPPGTPPATRPAAPRADGAAPAGGFMPAGATEAGAAGMPSVNRKGNLDRRFPTAPTSEGLPSPTEGGAAAPSTKAAGAVRGPSEVSFATANAPHLSLSELERSVVPRTVPVDVGDAPERGARDAPVTIVEFGDYHGPETKEAEPAVRALVQGPSAPARLFWKDADRGDGPDYHLPARAARAAGEQDAFWSMHDRLLRGAPASNTEKVRKLAREIELDDRAFATSLSSDGLLTAIEADAQRASKLPVLCTPAFIVNGVAVDGGSIAAAALRTAVDDDLTARTAKSAPPRPTRAIATAAPISGTAFEPAKLARSIADAAARRSSRAR